MKDMTQLTGEITTTDLEDILPKIILAEVETAARALRYGRQLTRINRDLINTKGRSIFVPIRGAITAQDLDELEAPLLAKAAYSTKEVKPSKIGVGVGISQESIDAVEIDVIRDHILEAGEAMADLEDTKIMTELLTGTTAVPPKVPGTLSYEDVVDGRNKVKVAKRLANVMVIHPDQESDLLKDSRFIDSSQYGDREPLLAGEIGKISGLKILTTTQITTGTALVLDTTKAAWLAIKREIDLKRKEEASTDSVELYFFQEFGVELVNDDATCKITGC